MSFDLLTIGILGVMALVYAGIIPPKTRPTALLIGSIFCVYWLQPRLPIRFSDFILPTATIGLTTAVWYFVSDTHTREDGKTLGLIGALVLGISLFRFLPAQLRLTPSRPPQPLILLMGLVSVGVLVWLLHRATKNLSKTKVMGGGIAGITLIFILLKTPLLATAVSRLWRGGMGFDTTLASPLDLTWLGFSYIAFRLIHTLRDKQVGKMPALTLQEFATYTLFFPALIAGPIDRADRFAPDFRTLPDLTGLDPNRFARGLARIIIGITKKFIIADLLAQGMSLNATNVAQATTIGSLWLLLYGYAFRLFFDFAGYSDIAIGIGILFGIQLPENFNAPYLKTNITKFWQSWHMTLSHWARFYIFSPLSRSLLRRKPRPSSLLIVLVSQVATMVVIGLWHGVAWHFLVWGLWHGVGLFAHKQWGDRTRKWMRGFNKKPRQKQILSGLAWLLTFHYVVVGWVWFVLPDLSLATHTVGRLFGLGW